MKRISTILLSLISIAASAQSYYNDALLYSRNFVGGTARSGGVAGAFGAVGADLSSVGINPAGLALYRSGDISISPGFSITNNNANYMGVPTMSPSAKFYFGQAGVVWAIPTKNANSSSDLSFSPNSLKFVTVALNYSRQSMFNRVVDFSNTNSNTSTINEFANYVDATRFGNESYSDDIFLALRTGLVGYDSLTDEYYSNMPAPVRQLGHISTRGAKDNIDLALGFNINDKVYIGTGIGVSLLNFQRSAWYGEDRLVDSLTIVDNYTLSSELRTRGMGVNFNVGFLYRPASWVRFGLAYHMPTFYNLNENYTAALDIQTDSFPVNDNATYELFKYKYQSPMKGVFSAAFFIKQYAFISVDYEFLNYGGNRFNFGRDYKTVSDAENKFMKDNFNYGHNVRAGVEGAIKVVRLRAGYALSTSPYKSAYNDQGQNEMRHFATAGIGYRGKSFYADVAYVYSIMKDVSSTQATDYVRNTFKQHQLMITVGFRFGNKSRFTGSDNNTIQEPADRSF